MIMPGAEIKVLVATKPVDFRRQADGLAALVQEALRENPYLCGGSDYVAEPPQRLSGPRRVRHPRHIIFRCWPAIAGRRRSA